uniref:pregnancy-specific beta-1-glycoprotein 1-like n=1 Tax=Oncorhynchus gorbuscha TaxID=8017 RepID=UPI001EAF65C5|nr:pregnancy-specific beta-1-glycoprotein 1-like [Oncorhynchus gorbuscha]
MCSVTYDSRWNYQQYKDWNYNVVSQSVRHTITGNTFTISRAAESDQGQYWCEGDRASRPISSQPSDPLTLTVKALPKTTLTVKPNPAFTGETVTLMCSVTYDSRRNYQWYKDWNYNVVSQSVRHTITGDTFTISRAAESDQGQYWCEGNRASRPISSQPSDPVTLTVKALPKTTLIVKPNPAFTGETVTLMCSVTYDSRRNYQWYKDWNYNVVSQSVRHTITGDTFTISRAAESDQGQYWCEGNRASRPISSQPSDPVTLTVKALPKTTLTVKPNPAYTGEKVTLMCSVTYDSRWNYQWYKDWNYNVVSQSVRHTITGDTFTISRAAESDQGLYWCEGNRVSRPTSSQPSDPLTLTVKDQPQPVLSISPQWMNPGDSVTLSCEVDKTSTDWRFSWYRTVPYRAGLLSLSDKSYSLQPLSDNVTSEDSYTLIPAGPTHTGGYVCRAGRGDPVYDTLYSEPQFLWSGDGDVILESPVHPVTEGDSVTLTCTFRHQGTNPKLNTDFYKDGTLIKNETTGEMTIPTVSKSDEGFYKCKSGEGESPESWVTVRVPPGSIVSISLTRLLCGLLVMSPFLLVSIVLTVKCCRARGLCSTVKSCQDQIACDDVIEQNESSV